MIEIGLRMDENPELCSNYSLTILDAISLKSFSTPDLPWTFNTGSRQQMNCLNGSSFWLATSKKRTQIRNNLDTEMGPVLRLRNRKLQLLDYKPVAQSLERFMAVRFQGLAHTMTTFGIARNPTSVRTPPMPDGIELVFALPHAYVVDIKGLEVGLFCKFHVGAKGDLCVLLCTTGKGDKSHPLSGPTSSPWEQIAWFDPTRPPDQQTVSEWFDEAVHRLMRKLADEAK